VTGGTGVLGRELVPRLGKAGNIVRVMSRRAGKSNAAGDVEWAQADIMTGTGLAEAVREEHARVDDRADRSRSCARSG